MSIHRRVKLQLLALGVNPTLAERFSSQVEQWCCRSGPEWTVERLKALKTSLMEMLATGCHYKVPLGWATRLNRERKVIFKDRLVHDIFSQARDNLMLAENFIRVYQSIVLTDTSDKQIQKMYKAVTAPFSGDVGYLDYVVNNIGLRRVSKRVRESALLAGSQAEPLTFMVWSEKNSPEIKYQGSKVVKIQSVKRKYLDPNLIWPVMARDVRTKDLWERYPKEVSKALIGSEGIPLVTFMETPYISDTPAGSIVAIQEGGAKARWIANPWLPYQAFGEPLKRKLQSIYQSLYPEVRVLDQDSGRKQVADWLSEGNTVHCYDCSSFTDRFPLQLQLKILKLLKDAGVVSEFDYDAFLLVVTKPWNYARTRDLLKWEVGQPLGYGPSFALATLTHAALLDSLSPGSFNKWMVVGDDVVIIDPILAQEYHSVMTKLGVEINLSKSVISPLIGEFLGKLITAKGVNPSVKAKPLSSESQVLALAEFFGEEFVNLLGEEHWRVKLVSKLPKEFGGLDNRHLGATGIELSEINTAYLQRMFLDSEIRDFHGEDQNDARGLRKFLVWKSKLLDPITNLISSFSADEIKTNFGENLLYNDLNAFTDIQTVLVLNNNAAVLDSRNTFVYLLDNQWFLKQEPRDQPKHNSPLFNRFGYAYRNELPSTLSKTISYVYFSSTNQKESNDISLESSIRVFKDPRKTWRKIRP